MMDAIGGYWLERTWENANSVQAIGIGRSHSKWKVSRHTVKLIMAIQ